jgi:hypothetical protein
MLKGLSPAGEQPENFVSFSPKLLTFGRIQAIRPFARWPITALRYALPFVAVVLAVAIACAFRAPNKTSV